MAVSDGRQIVVFKDLGLVSQVFDEQTLSSLRGHLAVGHTRYSTTGSPTWENAQPTFRTTAAGTGLALGHNGNLVNTAELVRRRDAALAVTAARATATARGNRRSSALVGRHHRLRRRHRPARRRRRRPRGRGGGAAPAARPARARSASPSATRPRSTPPATATACARWCWAGSTAAGWSPPRPPRSTSSGRRSSARSSPASCIAIDAEGLRSSRFAAPEPKGCVFEYVYLARPDTSISGRGRALRARRDRAPARRRAPGRGRPRHPRARSPGRRPRSATPSARASPTARAWSRTPTWAARSSSPRRPSASWASGSSSTRCARSSGASASSSSTTRSSAATPSARSCGCCARPARSRCTSASRARRCAGPASTASTSRRAPS